MTGDSAGKGDSISRGSGANGVYANNDIKSLRKLASTTVSAQRPRRRQRLNFTRISVRERLHGRDRFRIDDGRDDAHALVLSQNGIDFIR